MFCLIISKFNINYIPLKSIYVKTQLKIQVHFRKGELSQIYPIIENTTIHQQKIK